MPIPIVWIGLSLAGIMTLQKLQDSGLFSSGYIQRGHDQNAAVVAAKADLAQRLGISVDSIELVSITKVIWPSAVIDCNTGYEPFFWGRSGDVDVVIGTPPIGWIIQLRVSHFSTAGVNLSWVIQYRVNVDGSVLLCTDLSDNAPSAWAAPPNWDPRHAER